MANTVNSLNYANTFSDWVNTTNLTTIELNSLGKGTYSKDSGVLILNGAEALRANGQVNIYNSLLSVIGTGSSATIQNGLTVGGTTTLNGSVIYSQNTLTLGASVTSGQLSYININRGSSGANASIRWNEPNKYFDILDVNSSNYYRILTTNTITDSVTTISSTIAASATAVNTVNNLVNSAFNQANIATSSAASAIKTINGTAGSATPISTTITFAGAYGFTVVGSSNTVTFGTPQNLQTNASPTFVTVTANLVGNLTGNVTGNVIGNASGTALNITQYTVNQSIGTANNVQFNSVGVGTAPDTANTGSIRSIGTITAYYSDDRLKTRLGNIESALEKLMTLNGFYYEPNQTAQELGYRVTKEVGLSAQEVQNILPEVVAPAPIDDKYLTIHYERVIPLLVEAIKELKNEINTLKGNTNG